jgi:translation initiation factor 1
MAQKPRDTSSGKELGKPDDKGKRVVYSTDPEDEPRTATPLANQGTNPAAPLTTRQKNQPVIVGIERKGRGGKTVSIVTGVMSHPAGKEALLKLLKTRLGTGGTLKDDVIEIQGDRRDDIVAILTGLGYKAKKSGG